MKRILLNADLEVLLPIVMMAVLASLIIVMLQSASAYFLIPAVVLIVAQPMILTRTFDQPKGNRFRYVMSNELLCVAGVGSVAGVAFLIAN